METPLQLVDFSGRILCVILADKYRFQVQSTGKSWTFASWGFQPLCNRCPWKSGGQPQCERQRRAEWEFCFTIHSHHSHCDGWEVSQQVRAAVAWQILTRKADGPVMLWNSCTTGMASNCLLETYHILSLCIVSRPKLYCRLPQKFQRCRVIIYRLGWRWPLCLLSIGRLPDLNIRYCNIKQSWHDIDMFCSRF